MKISGISAVLFLSAFLLPVPAKNLIWRFLTFGAASECINHQKLCGILLHWEKVGGLPADGTAPGVIFVVANS
jgi:hypothetical protein